MMRRLVCLFFIFCCQTQNEVEGLEIGFNFTGIVIQSLSNPYGVSIPAFSPVTGKFIYDTASPATHSFSCTDCAGYRQQRFDGFSATFGSVNVRADDYLIEVSNDLAQPSGPDADVFTVRFASDINPPLSSPLVVNGTAQSVGLFSINLVGSSSVLSDSSLPNSLALGDFPSTLSFLADTPGGFIDVLYTISSLSPFAVTSTPAVPEPSTGFLLSIGILLGCSTRLRLPRNWT